MYNVTVTEGKMETSLRQILYRNTYCVVFRTGGTYNFQWKRSLGMSKEEANAKRQEVERMGYKAHVENYGLSLSIGLPEGYEYAR
jgi:hypothetical protein